MPLSTGLKLPKSARLHHRSLQEKLFAEGSKLHEFPLKLIWHSLTAEELRKNFRDKVPDLIGPIQVLVSVPKKKRRKAVDRVLMRRRIREAFRRNRLPLLQSLQETPLVRTLSIGVIYMKEANVEYSEIEAKLQKLLSRLSEKLKAKYSEEEEEISNNIYPKDSDTFEEDIL